MSRRSLALRLLLLTVTMAFCTPVEAADEPIPGTVEFNRDIRPILSNLCYHCHGPDKTKRQAKLRFDTRDGLFARRDDHHVVVPGKPATSALYQRITSQDADERMPPADSGLTLTPPPGPTDPEVDRPGSLLAASLVLHPTDAASFASRESSRVASQRDRSLHPVASGP